VSHNAGQFRLVSETSTAIIVAVLSALMVSRVRFRSFKDVRLNGKTAGVLLLIAGAYGAIVSAGLERASIFLFLVMAYIALGLTEEVIFFRSRRVEARAARESKDAPAAASPVREEEVLRELGAFDDEDEDETDDEALGAPPAVKRP
jgi:CDP-diacylglycerol--serine O-phosphatidyltransferase